MARLTSLKRIYEIIEKSENPLIFFDDDQDGLCSYLLIKKHFGKGNGIVIKSSPKVEISYLKKIEEYSPDLVIVLDKPLMPQEFVDRINVPIVWIDHHPINDIKGVNYFNPLFKDEKDDRPTSYWCYKLTNENLWISTIGVIADHSMATFKEFKREFPDLCNKESIDELMFNSNLTKLIEIFGFILKDYSHYKVLQYVALIEKIKSPYELIEGTSDNAKEILKVYDKVNGIYRNLLVDALKEQDSKIHLFIYPSGKMSFTSELSNQISRKFPDKVVIVGRKKDGLVKMSLRYQKGDIREMLEKALEGLNGFGGGHKHACGSHINIGDFDEFIQRLESYIK